jgi:hypothetical protein
MKPSDQIKKYHVVFKNKFVSNVNPKDAQRNFLSKFKVSEKACERIFSGYRVRIKKGISQQSALDFQDKLFNIGMLCDIELDFEQKPRQALVSVQTSKLSKYRSQFEDDDDEEDDDCDADFDLNEILMQTEYDIIDKKNAKSIVEVIKYHDNNIIDIKYLQKNGKYIDTDNKFCLAEFDRKHKAYFYFDDFIQGTCYDSHQKAVKTDSLRINKNMVYKKKRIYRHCIPDQGYVTLSNDLYTYYIRKKFSIAMPSTQITKKPKVNGIKHFARSIVCHMLIIFFIGLFVSFENTNTTEPKRYAKIAGNKIHDLQKLRKQQLKMHHQQKQEIVQHNLQETVMPSDEARPPKKIQKKHVKTKNPKKIAKNSIAYNTNTLKKSTPAGPTLKGNPLNTSPSRQKGNGGVNVGNVSTPDVNQKGILGMIKDTGMRFLNTEALAAVTQLDAVNVSGNLDKNALKIGGIKGHLGDRKVQMSLNTGGGRVNTKGANQVLRTGGFGDSDGRGTGSRMVGELAKGNTGNKAVKAMIRANFQQSVHQIQGGGMSRTAVKKVIDQHIDDITYCYEVALISDPSIVGKAVYEWRILMNGSVGDVHILNASIQNQEILGCIKKSIKTWRFPQPHRAQVMVSYPFVFDIVGF